MIHIAVTVYGEWHRRVFLKKVLPTLELEALGVPAKFWIWTKENEVGGLLEAKHEIEAKIPCEIVGGDLPLGYKNGWQQTGDLAEPGDVVLQLQSDIIWSKGSFAHIGELVKSGKRMIYCPQPRGTEKFYPDYPLTGEQLMKLVHEDGHPVNLSEDATKRGFTRHPEVILWSIKGGWIARTLVREPLMCPAKTFFNHHNLPMSKVPFEQLAVIESSDQACGVSLSTRDVELDHYRGSNSVIHEETVSQFIDAHKSSQAFDIASLPSLLRYGEVDQEEIDRTVEDSYNFVKQAFTHLNATITVREQRAKKRAHA